MLYHALPKLKDESPFLFTMKAVAAAQESLVDRIATGKIFDLTPHTQDKKQEIRYSRNAEFTDEVALEFLNRNLSSSSLANLLASSSKPELLNPFYF